jgi:spermidine synthase
VAGAALAGYALLPAFGSHAVTLGAAATNVAVGLLALAYSRTRPAARSGILPPVAHAEAAAAAASGPPGARGLATGLAGAALAASGAVAMVYEVAWTRALTLVIGSSTYAFTAMLVAFLAGIAGGSALYAWRGARRPATPTILAVLQASIGLATLAILLIFERAPDLFLLGVRWSDSPGFVQCVQVVVSACALLLATLPIGATFPCGVAVVVSDAGRAGRDVGHLYALNTLGAIAGTVLAGFVLLPRLGVHASLKLGIAANLLVASGILMVPVGRRTAWRWAGVTASLAVAAGVSFVPPWDPRVMASGPAVYAKRYLAGGGWPDLGGKEDELLFYRDGISGTVSVHRRDDRIFLRINGKTDASASKGTEAGDTATQVMLGHLPLLIHPAPRAVLVIGLGSGMTAGAVARHAVERIDIAEIEPAVVDASRFFIPWHGDVLRDARVRSVIADGRNFLLTTPIRYDVIISEPSNPWIGGLASLFSAEFFALARTRLQPGGIMAQWLQGYNLPPEDFRMVVRTFRGAFPGTSIWPTSGGDYLLLGRTEARPLDLELIKDRFRRNPALRSDLARLRVDAWAGVLGYFGLGEGDAARLAEGAGLNTDDRLPLEFSAPRALYVNTSERNRELLRGFKTADLPDVTPDSRAELEQAEVRYAIGLGYLRKNEPRDALAQFQRALLMDSTHEPSLVGTGWALLASSQPAAALEEATKALALEPRDVEALGVAAIASLALGQNRQAIGYLERALRLHPRDYRIRQAMQAAQLALLGETLPPILWKP